MTPENRNMLWAGAVVDELARHGVRWAVVAPGSRSTPIVVALARHPNIETLSIIDERSAAFVALGIGMVTGVPAAVVCSSGTAAANFLPAVVEARYAGVPLLVLTADRPHELRESGANQTIDQVRMYGTHALWSVDVPLPEQNPSGLVVRSLRTLIARAFAMAIGRPRGPVHLNFPLRKPLEPTVVPSDVTGNFYSGRGDHVPFSRVTVAELVPVDAQVDTLSQAVIHARRAVVFCGPFTPADSVAGPLAQFVAATGIPVFADPLSNLRWSSVETIGGYDSFGSLRDAIGAVDLWIQLGGQPSSKAVEDYLASGAASRVVQVSHDGVWRDPYHQITDMIHASPALLLERVTRALVSSTNLDREWAAGLWAREHAVWRAFQSQTEWFDGAIVARSVESLPEDCNLVVANSLPVRNVEQFAMPGKRSVHVYCNRGASGIDGTVSTAFGVAVASGRPTCLITGDLALLHDIGGLLCASRMQAPLVIVVVNNDGGGIFRRLPVRDFEPAFTELFLTPHGRSFEGAAMMYGLKYRLVDQLDVLQSAVMSAFGEGSSWLIEARTNSADDLCIRGEWMQAALNLISRELVGG